ncbi:MAG: hypothetical protein GFH27_549293n307 [Chloroflexi bacterium AL-W]|nr:hypothetical protein [Chloroflexi bacterium AL-N1]NOK67578.1 hypothetical protein [Chloroflexi bacterium AL-N10]NOK75652.1 hypothetical protein [Chloroflexi bacterium AL-N5]NOK82440.1 hypothetical protein [Chloroflexi bacterium AL-W]NOK90285.1 hypothetical protein [Chloroflexi bacterium AL-N15]
MTLPTNMPDRQGLPTMLLWYRIITDFLRGHLREHFIDLRPLSHPMRLLTVIGLVFIFGFIGGIFFKDTLRFQGILEPLVIDSSTTRGLLVPNIVVPVTFIAVVLGWGYLLAGALHVRRWLRWVVLICYMIFTAMPLMVTVAGSLGSLLTIVGVLSLLLAIFLAFIILPRLKLAPVLEWSLIMLLHGSLMLLYLGGAVQGQILSDGELRASNMLSVVFTTGALLTAPFLFFAGLGWVDFGLTASAWVSRSLRQRATLIVAIVVLFVVLGSRLFGLLSVVIADGVSITQWQAWAGAIIFCVGLLPIALWRRRQPRGGKVPLQLIAVLSLVPLISTFLLAFFAITSLLFTLVNTLTFSSLERFNQSLASAQVLLDLETQHRPLIIAVIALIITGVALRRGYASIAAYGLILTWHRVTAWATATTRPLHDFQFAHADIDTVLLVVFSITALIWLWQRQLTLTTVTRLLGLAVLMALLNQTDFLDQPLSPFFGFAGIFFLLFGIIWNVLTVGGQVVNKDSPGFPRTSRLLLYIGYAMLAISSVHWFMASHNIAQQMLQSDINLVGFLTFGLPLAYLALVEGGVNQR